AGCRASASRQSGAPELALVLQGVLAELSEAAPLRRHFRAPSGRVPRDWNAWHPPGGLRLLHLRGQKPSVPAAAFAAFDSVPCLAGRCGHFAYLRSRRRPGRTAGREAELRAQYARRRRQTPRSVAPLRLDRGLPLDFPLTPREPEGRCWRIHL